MFFIAIIPLISLVVGAILMSILKEIELRKKIYLLLSSGNLIINSILLIINSVFPNQEIFFNILISHNQYFFMEFIFLFQFVFSIFNKYELKDFQNAYLFDAISLIIFLSLIGIVISINFLAFLSYFFLAIMLIGIIFYFGEFKKEFSLLKKYFIVCFLSLVCLLTASIFFYLEAGTMQFYNLGGLSLSYTNTIIISILIILGIGIPCGIFPFSIYHLKNYFQETSFSHLLIYMLFNFISIFGIIQLLSIFNVARSFNIIIMMFLSSLGLVTAIYHIILEIFTSQDGYTYSLKKVMGYTFICDFNLILLLLSNIYLLSTPILTNLLHSLIFFYVSLMLIKLLVFSTFIQIANHSYEDNVRTLGNFWLKYKIYGIIMFLSGLILIFPLSLIYLNSLFLHYELIVLEINSLVALITTLTIVLLVIYLLILLLCISHFFIQVYLSKRSSYLKKETSYNIPVLFIYLITVILIGFIIVYAVIYYINPYFFYNLFFI